MQGLYLRYFLYVVYQICQLRQEAGFRGEALFEFIEPEEFERFVAIPEPKFTVPGFREFRTWVLMASRNVLFVANRLVEVRAQKGADLYCERVAFHELAGIFLEMGQDASFDLVAAIALQFVPVEEVNAYMNPCPANASSWRSASQ